MKTKEIIQTILNNRLTCEECGFVRFDDEDKISEQIKYIFGENSYYSGLQTDCLYLWYWSVDYENRNVFSTYDAQIRVKWEDNFDTIYLIKMPEE